MSKIKTSLPDYIANELGLDLTNSRQYRLTPEEHKKAKEIKSKSKPKKKVSKKVTKTVTKITKEEPLSFDLTAWTKEGKIMSIDEFCEFHSLDRGDISSWRLCTHTKVPTYNISFKENKEIATFDFEAIIKKHTENLKPINPCKNTVNVIYNDFDTTTYTDVHIGMDTNSKGNSMYATEWNRESILKSAETIVLETLKYQTSNVLIVDELGDFLDGYNAQTTRGGHHLPQNMTNEEAFDCGVEFKMLLLNGLISSYEEITFNNICNDNHAGSFGYFVNSAFKQLAEKSYANVTVNNHRKFISHYIQDKVCFLITHGKDDSTLKFGFKPHLDTKQIEKIDQYIKHHNLYGKAERFIFKKGDSHQCLFDMSGSDDFDYFNYPALSPSSQWVQNNFKKGRRGFVIENFKGIESNQIVKFIK